MVQEQLTPLAEDATLDLPAPLTFLHATGPCSAWFYSKSPLLLLQGGGYLSMHLVPRQPALQSSVAQLAARYGAPSLSAAPHAALGEEEEDEQEAEICTVCQAGLHWHTYHIVYSPSFDAPVMYFEGQDSGAPT